MKLEFETPKACDDCLFCYDAFYCVLTEHERNDYADKRQDDCPFDLNGATIKREGIRTSD